MIHNRLENLIDEMLEGHISNTAAVLGIHRNTLAKRVAEYKNQEKPAKRAAAR